MRSNMLFEAGCDILEMATALTKEDIFNLSSAEIIATGFKVSEEMNKKK